MVGAGVMGGDIAAWCAQRGLNVTLQDRELKFIEPALQRAREGFEKRLKDAGKAAELMTRLTADVAGDGVPGADVIIEAIFENADAKHELFARVEPRMKASAILASNTSSIMLEQLDDKLPDPGRLVGLHFFNPVSQLPLVEIVRGEHEQRGIDPEGHRLHAQDRQAAAALQELAGVSRESRAGALPLRGDVRAAGRHRHRSHRRSGAALRHAHGAGRARRRRRPRRVQTRR